MNNMNRQTLELNFQSVIPIKTNGFWTCIIQITSIGLCNCALLLVALMQT